MLRSGRIGPSVGITIRGHKDLFAVMSGKVKTKLNSFCQMCQPSLLYVKTSTDRIAPMSLLSVKTSVTTKFVTDNARANILTTVAMSPPLGESPYSA